MPVDHTKNIIEVRDASFSYGAVDVLRDVVLEIHKGDYVGIVGPNGSGKTTLFKIILGLLKPRTGSVRLFGQDVCEFKQWYKLGYVPQKAVNFDASFPATVYEIVAMGRYGKGKHFFRTDEDRKAIEDALMQVGMLEYKDRQIGDLSGGQQQRVFIARALVNEPEVIFLDEPTAGVDEKTQDEFYSLLKKMNEDMGITLILISHDIERITKEVMHIICVDRTVNCHISPEEYLEESGSVNVHGRDVKIITYHHHN